MTFDVQTNAGKHVVSNSACVRCQRNTNHLIFDWLKWCCAFWRNMIFHLLSDQTANLFSDCPTNTLSICHLVECMTLYLSVWGSSPNKSYDSLIDVRGWAISGVTLFLTDDCCDEAVCCLQSKEVWLWWYLVDKIV